MKIITIASQKGGTGKTTTAAALAQAAAKAGKRVLAIDLDPQGNFSAAVAANTSLPGSYELLTGTPAAQTIQETEQGVFTMAASPDLATIRTKAGSARRLQQALEPLKKSFDLCLIDTPPQMGDLTYNALQASSGVIVPLETDSNSLQGLFLLDDIVRQMQQSNPGLSITGVILTRYDNRPKINRFFRDAIAERGRELGAPLLGTIRAGVAIREAQALQQSLFDYAPHSKPAQDYKKLYHTIMEG